MRVCESGTQYFSVFVVFCVCVRGSALHLMLIPPSLVPQLRCRLKDARYPTMVCDGRCTSGTVHDPRNHSRSHTSTIRSPQVGTRKCMFGGRLLRCPLTVARAAVRTHIQLYSNRQCRARRSGLSYICRPPCYTQKPPPSALPTGA